MQENKTIGIRMLSAATSVDGQGVGSAYLEQVALVKEQSDLFSVFINNEKGAGKAPIRHVHTVNPTFISKMDKHHCNIIYVHFIPSTLDGSIRLPKLAFHVFKKYVIHAYKKADEIVVVNPSFIPPLLELGMKEENITYIPNYVSKDQFHRISEEERVAVRERYGLKKEDFIVLGCGQVQTRKGVLDFVEVAKHNPDMQFVWAGGFSFGAITDGYEELKKVMDNPPENVKFIGIIPRAEMNLIFNMADSLFMPSFSELFPMSILEAVNSGKPVVLRDLELYEGILWDDYAKATDVAGWDEIFRRLKNDPAYYEEYSKKADHIAEFYSKEHVGQMWREYYPRVLAKWSKVKKIKQ